MTLNVASKAPSSISSDDKDIGRTKVEDPQSGKIADPDNYPDGGLRAWSIVLGVRLRFDFRGSFTDILDLWLEDHVLHIFNVSQFPFSFLLLSTTS